MKKIILLIFILGTVCNAQIKDISRQQYFNKGDFEFTFSLNIGSSSINNKSTYRYTGSPVNNTESSYKELYFHLGAAAGYYIIDNLSVEPELDINLSFDNSSFLVIGNLCYSFSKPASNVSPFVKIGYGWSEYKAEPYYYGGSFDYEDYKIINTGGGLKIRYSGNMMLRMEINYRILSTSASFTSHEPDYSSSSKTDINISVISFSLGIIILF